MPVHQRIKNIVWLLLLSLSLMPCLCRAVEPVAISTCQQLQSIHTNESFYYYLTNDLDCSSVTNFIPLRLYGYIDGQNHTIKGVTIDLPAEDYVGLFFWVSPTTTVIDLKVDSIFVRGRQYVGALAGTIEGRVENVSINQANIVGAEDVGGLGGYLTGTATRVLVSSTNVLSQGNAGGLAGKLITHEDTKGIFTSSTEGSVYGLTAGGLVGLAESGHIVNSFSLAKVSGPSSATLGGLIGYRNDFFSSAFPFLSYSYAAGPVDSRLYSGGLVGNAVNVDAADSPIAVFWDTQTTGQIHSAASPDNAGYTTAAAIQMAPFFNWDYFTTWITNGTSYPKLRWHLEPTASLWNTFNEIKRAPEMLAASLPPDADYQRSNVNWANLTSTNVNWTNLEVLSRPFYWNDAPVSVNNVNWLNLIILGQHNVNWSDIAVASYVGTNWADVNPLVRSGINWADWSSLSKKGINWVNLPIMSRAGINWSTLSILDKLGTNWAEWRTVTRSGINWSGISDLSKGGGVGVLNWANIGVITSNINWQGGFVLANSVNWQGVSVLSKKAINWANVSTLSRQGVNWDSNTILNSTNLTPFNLLALRMIGKVALVPLTPYVQWKSAYFNTTQLANINVSGDLANPAQDGTVNLFKYAFNISPWQIYPNAFTSSVVDNHFTVQYRRNIHATDISLQMMARASLFDPWSTNSFTLTTQSIDSDTELVTATDTVDITTVPSRFYSLRVTKDGGSVIAQNLAFSPANTYFTLTVNVQGSGTITDVGDQNSCSSACVTRSLKGTQNVLTATPAQGYKFDGWTGACNSSNSTCDVRFNSPLQVTALFSKIEVPSGDANLAMCYRCRSITVPSYLAARYIARGATVGACSGTEVCS